MIRSLDLIWRGLEDAGYLPMLVADFRPWVVVAGDMVANRFIVVIGSTCPSEIYAHAISSLPTGLELEDSGDVANNDYMVFG